MFNFPFFSNEKVAVNKVVEKKVEVKKEVKKLTIEEVVNKLKEHYSTITEIESNFEQTFFHKAYKRTKKSSGKLYFTNDLKMKWIYKTPEKKFIISNSKTLWIYEPENEQVFRAKIEGSELETIAKFLAGRLDLFKDYKLKLINQKTLFLEPKGEKSFRSIELTLNDDYKIIKTKMVDNFGNINTMIYSNFKMNNLNLSKSFFEFKVPDGVELIEN